MELTGARLTFVTPGVAAQIHTCVPFYHSRSLRMFLVSEHCVDIIAKLDRAERGQIPNPLEAR